MLTVIVVGADPGIGKYSATVNGSGWGGSSGNAIGPRSFSTWRNSASRIVSPNRTRPETIVRVISPMGVDRSRMPISVTWPEPSVRTGIAST